METPLNFKIGDRVVALRPLYSYSHVSHSPDVKRFSDGIVTDVSPSHTGIKDAVQLGITFGEKEVRAPSEAVEHEDIYDSPLWKALR